MHTAEQEKNNKLPKFRKTMTSTEIMELVEATHAKRAQAALTKTRNLRPEKFAGKDGFRFEMTYVGKDEVEKLAKKMLALNDKQIQEMKKIRALTEVTCNG